MADYYVTHMNRLRALVNNTLAHNERLERLLADNERLLAVNSACVGYLAAILAQLRSSPKPLSDEEVDAAYKRGVAVAAKAIEKAC